MSIFNKKNKIDTRNMSQEELQDYVNNLPEKVPPKWSSVAWSGGLGVLSLILFFTRVATDGFQKLWVLLALGTICVVGAGYLAYKILTFDKRN